jgi:O-antigen ligase
MISLRLQSWAGEALSAICALLLFVVMFDHMTAIKYIGIGVLIAIVASLAIKSSLTNSRERAFPASPLLIALGVWALWTLMSASWSVAPGATLHAWLDEVAYPLAAFYAFWLVGQSPLKRQVQLQNVAWATCLILAAISVIYFHYLDPGEPKPGLMHFYARVGHSSTLALMAIPLFATMAARTETKIRGLTGALFCVVIGGATLNRFFWIALAVVAVVLLWPRSSRERMRAWTALGALLLVTLVAAGFSNKLRLMGPAVSSADAPAVQVSNTAPGVLRVVARASDTQLSPLETAPAPRPESLIERLRVVSGMNRAMSSDARPRIWGFYGSQVPSHPWIGIGFGKPLPSLAYGRLVPDDLLKLDGNVRTHAHNLFLNTLLQVGVVGLILQLAVFWGLAYQFFAVRRLYPQLYRAGIALILGMLAKNLTDDFMWQSTMLMFWAYCGWLLGQSAIRLNTLGAPASYRATPHSVDAKPVERELETVS